MFANSFPSALAAKGKPRDLDYPACWTGARRCAPKSDCAPVPPNGKKGHGGTRTAVVLPPTNNIPGFTHWAIGLPVTSSKNIIYEFGPSDEIFLKKPSHRPKPAAAGFSQPCAKVVDGPWAPRAPRLSYKLDHFRSHCAQSLAHFHH